MGEKELLNFIKKNNIEVRGKDNWKMGWHLVVPLYFFFVGLFNPELKQKFYKNYFTTLGRTIYVPDQKKFMSNLTRYEAIILHEHQHMCDIAGFFDRLKYILSKKHRLFYEKRGYFWNVYVEFRKTGSVSLSTKESIIEQFSGSMYNYMTTKEDAEKIFDQLLVDARNVKFPSPIK